MNDLKGLRVVVVGAGAIGSVLAVQLLRQGAEVLLADPSPTGGNASGVAAGMLAPAFESLLDSTSTRLLPLLREARGAWPALIQALPDAPALDRSGALFKLQPGDAGDDLLSRFTALGLEGRRLGSDAALALAPGLAGAGDFLFTPEDWRLEAGAMLLALHETFAGLGGVRLNAAAIGFEGGTVRFDRLDPAGADAVVLATGPNADGWTEAMGQAVLTPIKGQILRFPGLGPSSGPVVRGPGVYVAPGAGGLVVGATMEPGRCDLTVEPGLVETLRRAAADLYPGLATAPFHAAAGVRAATSDGAPLVGASRQAGVLLARGARRNGWLLAPLIAQVIIDRLRGRSLSPAAEAFDPARF